MNEDKAHWCIAIFLIILLVVAHCILAIDTEPTRAELTEERWAIALEHANWIEEQKLDVMRMAHEKMCDEVIIEPGVIR